MTSTADTPARQDGHHRAEPEPALRHLAVILDGNRRWARDHGHTTLEGIQLGGERVLDLLTWCQDITDLTTLTLWPLSTENFQRPATELDRLLQVITDITQAIAATRRWRIRYLGTPQRLPSQSTRILKDAAERTRHLKGPVCNLAIAYGGRDEIVRGVQNLIISHQRAGTLQHLVQHFGPDDIGRHLDTAGQPDPDLVIRTAGEQRLSGFMPWQSAYAEQYFCPTPWPAFSRADLDTALDWYRRRIRNYGR
ncbi:polyprenyl diphosphate synthase [Kitasatospora sp. NPDC059327]|uniref:polyprenyl diphosphate synthase n=1 Tax=Kitasatospora sp. NPDC059327 TaxID=3346803 RepID=UPI003688080F